jgi:hypothetical protein
MSNNQRDQGAQHGIQNQPVHPALFSPTSSQNSTASLNSSFFTEMSLYNQLTEEPFSVLSSPENNRMYLTSPNSSAVTAVPYSGNDTRKNPSYDQQTGKQSSWCFVYLYGVWLDGFIYCTVSRREDGGCTKRYSSHNRTTSSFIKHLEQTHKITEAKSTSILFVTNMITT